MMEVTTNPKCSNCTHVLICVLYRRIKATLQAELCVRDSDDIYSAVASNCKLYEYSKQKTR